MSTTCYLLSPRGFCSGVTRAVDMAEQVLKLYKTVYIIEDIIHNKPFMNYIIEKGIIKVNSLDEVPYGSTIMFSAHGVSPKIIDEAEKKELTIIDATCPIVKSIQNSAKLNSSKGKQVIIIGNRAHAEIIALIGYVNSENVFVVSNEMDIDLLPDFIDKDVIYYTQTTLDLDNIKLIVEALKKKIPHIKSDTDSNICYATTERQNVIKQIAKSLDLLIVVGSAYSSNASRLCEVSNKHGSKKTIRIDSKDDLDLSLLDNVSNIGITSGASTPEFLVEELIEFLKEKKDIIFENFNISD